jgi:chemotaxis signal transduction protein
MTEPARSAEAEALRRRLPDDALDAQTAALAAPIVPADGDPLALLVFHVGGERFGLPAASVERIFMPAPVRRVPHRSHPAFRGLIAHEGEIVLAASIERLLDLQPRSETSLPWRRFIMLGPAGRGWAFEVDRVEGVLTVSRGALRPAPMTIARGKGTASRMLAVVDGGEVALLDPEALRAGWEVAAA